MAQSAQVEVSKAEFGPLCKPVKNALDDAFKHMKGLSTLDWSKVHNVLIVGGSGSLPADNMLGSYYTSRSKIHPIVLDLPSQFRKSSAR